MAAVGNTRSSFTWTITPSKYHNLTDMFSSKTLIVCDRSNNHGICRLGLTRYPFEITLENVENNITLHGTIQICNEQSTLFTGKFDLTNSHPFKWTMSNQTMVYGVYSVKLNLKSPCFIIDLDLLKQSRDLSTDLEKLLTESKYSDVEIICSDGEIMKCHRDILSARSPVLEAMFSSDFKEVSSGQIKLDYFDTEVVKDLLSYIYTGMPKNLEDNAEILLQAGEQFQMEALKEICGKHLIKKLNNDNVLEYLALGDKYRQQDLKEASLEMVVKNAKALKENTKFTDFVINNPELMVEVFNAMASK